MDMIEGSETSANINQTLEIHPKVETVDIKDILKIKSSNTNLRPNHFSSPYCLQYNLYHENETNVGFLF
jgi:hypothetical protein